MKQKTYPEIINVYNKLREKTLFDNLEDRGIGYLGVLELLCKEIESYGEEVKKDVALMILQAGLKQRRYT